MATRSAGTGNPFFLPIDKNKSCEQASCMVQLICWLALAAIHVTPALAVIRPALLKKLYRLPPNSPLFLLMQHRSMLFAAIVAACLLAAFDPPSRPLAGLVTAISMISFLVLYVNAGRPASLRTIARVDAIGIIPLAIAVFLTARS